MAGVNPQLSSLPLKPHQQRVVDRISRPDQPGLVVMHGLGSGKTLSSIGALRKLNMPANITVPASLRGNYRKELDKWLGGVPDNVNIESQQQLALKGGRSSHDRLDIVDEAHRMRSEGSALRHALASRRAKKRLLLTATPTYNHPRDIAPLVNMAAGKTVLPEDKNEFEDRYIKYDKVNPNIIQRLGGVSPGEVPKLTNTKELKKILGKWVDYHPNSSEGFPRSTQQVVKVPMAPGQSDIYKSIMGQAPWWVRQKVKWGLPPGKSEFDKMRAFLTGARQVSNTSRGFVSGRRQEQAAKIDKAFNFFKQQLQKDPNYKGVVYSNYLDSGLAPYRERLQSAGIPFGEFSGDIPQAVRNQLVKDYNANKIKALLISSAGAEGLDLKATKLVQLLEPHYNEEKEKQIIGRAIRYGSHAALPEAERQVLVQRYLAQPGGSWLDRLLGKPNTRGTDEYLYDMAQRKSKLNNQVEALMNGINKSGSELGKALDEGIHEINESFPKITEEALRGLTNLPAVKSFSSNPAVVEGQVQIQEMLPKVRDTILSKLPDAPPGTLNGELVAQELEQAINATLRHQEEIKKARQLAEALKEPLLLAQNLDALGDTAKTTVLPVLSDLERTKKEIASGVIKNLQNRSGVANLSEPLDEYMNFFHASPFKKLVLPYPTTTPGQSQLLNSALNATNVPSLIPAFPTDAGEAVVKNVATDPLIGGNLGRTAGMGLSLAGWLGRRPALSAAGRTVTSRAGPVMAVGNLINTAKEMPHMGSQLGTRMGNGESFPSAVGSYFDDQLAKQEGIASAPSYLRAAQENIHHPVASTGSAVKTLHGLRSSAVDSTLNSVSYGVRNLANKGKRMLSGYTPAAVKYPPLPKPTTLRPSTSQLPSG